MSRLIKLAVIPAVLLAALLLTSPSKAQAQCGYGYGYQPFYGSYSSYYRPYGYGYNVYRPSFYGSRYGYGYPYRYYGAYPRGFYGGFRW